MIRQIRIQIGSVAALADLYDTKTSKTIWQALPFSSTINTWGDEIYFSIPLQMDLESGQEIVNLGDLGYWPPGSAFCIFFGLTPVSSSNEIRAASEVSIFGHLIDSPKLFKGIKSGESIVVEKV